MKLFFKLTLLKTGESKLSKLLFLLRFIFEWSEEILDVKSSNFFKEVLLSDILFWFCNSFANLTISFNISSKNSKKVLYINFLVFDSLWRILLFPLLKVYKSSNKSAFIILILFLLLFVNKSNLFSKLWNWFFNSILFSSSFSL